MKMKLENKGIGNNERMEIREEINKFVLFYWNVLRVGADKLNILIHEDYYAPERIQINNTRLHKWEGLKYANGVKYDELDISEEDLRIAISDIQKILDIAAKKEECNFKIEIKEN